MDHGHQEALNVGKKSKSESDFLKLRIWRENMRNQEHALCIWHEGRIARVRFAFGAKVRKIESMHFAWGARAA